jgi:hypothetical protein
MFHREYSTLESAAKDSATLFEFAAVAISMETFTVYTVMTLLEEDMVVHHIPRLLHSFSMLLALSPYINVASDIISFLS